MRSLQGFWWLLLIAFLTLLLAGCGGMGSSSHSTPPTPTFQLTVTAPPAGMGTITSTPAGINCPGTCTASFPQNTKVTLTAAPGTNKVFGGWSGACSGMTTTCTITLTAATNASASFMSEVELTVAVVGLGTGTVTGSPAGISCSAASTTGCSAGFPPNTPVTLTSMAGSNSSFGGWTGGGCSGTSTCSPTLSANATVTATFNVLVGDVLTVTTTGGGTGTVTSNPAGVNCTTGVTTGCSVTFPAGASIALTETPAAGSTFSSWSGGCTGTTTCSVTLNAASSVTASFAGSLQSINHIILFAQENRSLDHYFGAMLPYWAQIGLHQTDGVTFDGLPQFNNPPGPAPSIPGCNLTDNADSCTPDPTNPITSFSFDTLVLPSGKTGTVCEENQSPFWNEAHNDWDYTDPADQPAENPPPLNGFVFTAAYDARSNDFMDVNGVRAMGYYENPDLNFYYFMASNFATSDRWFSPLMDRTQVNRMYLLAATSQGHAYPIGQGLNNTTQLTAKTIFEALQNANPPITWKIYVNPQNLSYNGVACNDDISDANSLCLIQNSYINMFDYEETIINSAGKTPDLLLNIAPLSEFQSDAANGTLPQFALIEPASSAGLDEHPSDADGSPVNVQDGAYYVQKQIVEPLMQSPSWQDSALIFTYDEAGGLYDHVPPQAAAPPGDFNSPTDLEPSLNDICTGPGQLGNGTCTFGWTGYRVPVIVISPYSKMNFVSHTVRDTTAVLGMVESRFGIAPLTGRDASYYNNPANSMDEFFDYLNKPWATPPTPQPQSKAGNCDQTPPLAWKEPPTLTVTVSGGGSVTSTPAGINACTSTGGAACSSLFPSVGTTVTLTATPATGSVFTGWSGASCSGTGTCSIPMTYLVPTETVTAAFVP
jgi:phospholipase C